MDIAVAFLNTISLTLLAPTTQTLLLLPRRRRRLEHVLGLRSNDGASQRQVDETRRKA
jgi:hypothetical protein